MYKVITKIVDPDSGGSTPTVLRYHAPRKSTASLLLLFIQGVHVALRRYIEIPLKILIE